MSDEGISASLSIRSGTDRAEIPDIPRNILQALHATVTNMRDSLSLKRTLPSVIKVDDLEQLIAQLDQWSKPYDPISRTVKLAVSTNSLDVSDNGKRRSQYSSLAELKRELPGKTDQVVMVILNFDFLARNESSSEINQCELTLELKGSIRRAFYSLNDRNPLGGSGFDSDRWTAQFAVRYSDVLVARGLVNVVDEWYKSLPQRAFPKLGKIRAILHDSEEFEPFDLIGSLYKYSPVVFGGAAGAYFGPIIRPYTTTIESIPFWVVLISAFSLAIYLLFGRLVNKFRSLEQGYQVPLIEMTVGDQRRLERFGEMVSKRERKLDFWGKSVALAFAVGVLSSMFVFFFT
jgi:hypothetical protein